MHALQTIERKIIKGLTNDNSKLDVSARVFLPDFQSVFFDVMTTNTNAPSQSHIPTERVFIKHEQENKRQYNRQIINI